MDYSSVAEIFASTISLLGLWYFFRWPYQSYQAENLREELFALRGDLFDLAAAGIIDFNHPAYGSLRQTLNGFIRFGHHVSFLSLFGHICLGRSEDFALTRASEAVEHRKTALARAPQPARDRLILIEDRMHMAVLRHVTTSSILVLTIVPLLFLLAASVLTVRRRLAPWFHQVDSAAQLIGGSEPATVS